MRRVNTRCSGSHADSNPRRSASSVASSCSAGSAHRARHRTSHAPHGSGSPAVTHDPSAARPRPAAARLPPSTWIVVPVTNRAQSDARYTVAAATSSTRPAVRERRLHGEVAADAGRRDHVGCDAVHPDAAGPELERERLGEVHHGRLHRAVDREAGPGAVRLDRRDVDDRCAPSGIFGTHARMQWVTLTKFSRISASWPLSFTSVKGAWKPPPALFTRMSTVSSPSIHARTGVAVAHVEQLGVQWRPLAIAPRSCGPDRRDHDRRSARSAPKRASVAATSAPMPCAAPVTTATPTGRSTESGVIGIGAGG